MRGKAMQRTIAPLPADRLDDALALARTLDLGVRLDARWLRRLTFEDASCPPELLLVAEVDGALAGLCLGALRAGRGVVKLFGVTPRLRRRGIATALFDALEERLCAVGATEVCVEGVAPSYLLPGVDLAHTEAVAFLLQRGYETKRESRVDMAVHLHRVDLDTRDVLDRLAAEGIVIKRASPDEVDATAAMARETFSAEWAAEVSEAAYFDPLPLFIAREGARIVAFAAYDVTGPARFGPTGTDPAYRRRGIGGALLKECLRSLRDRGEVVAAIGWAGPIGYYARAVGARIHRVYWSFAKALAEAPET
jgi:mycothiol synthase